MTFSRLRTARLSRGSTLLIITAPSGFVQMMKPSDSENTTCQGRSASCVSLSACSSARRLLRVPIRKPRFDRGPFRLVHGSGRNGSCRRRILIGHVSTGLQLLCIPLALPFGDLVLRLDLTSLNPLLHFRLRGAYFGLRLSDTLLDLIEMIPRVLFDVAGFAVDLGLQIVQSGFHLAKFRTHLLAELIDTLGHNTSLLVLLPIRYSVYRAKPSEACQIPANLCKILAALSSGFAR